jgi:hypothetical protein
MPQEEFEDPNVANLSETKSQRAPAPETSPDKALWFTAAAVAALIVIAVFVSARGKS